MSVVGASMLFHEASTKEPPLTELLHKEVVLYAPIDITSSQSCSSIVVVAVVEDCAVDYQSLDDEEFEDLNPNNSKP